MVGEHGDAIKIKLRAPAVEGKANAALRRFLAEKLNIPQRAVVLDHGEKSRDKLIRINDLSEQEIRQRLGVASLEGGAPATPPLRLRRSRLAELAPPLCLSVPAFGERVWFAPEASFE